MKYCISCMEKRENDFGICPYCGFSGELRAAGAYQLQPESVFLKRYYIGRIIESDSFGFSYIAYDTIMSRKVVIRQLYDSSPTNKQEIPNEFLNYQKSEYFCEFYQKLASIYSTDFIQQVYTFKADNFITFAVSEYLSGITAEDYINRNGKIPYESAVQLILPTLGAIAEVHAKNLYHGNITLKNLRYIRDRGFAVCDFPAVHHLNDIHHFAEQSRQNDILSITRAIIMLMSGQTDINEKDFSRRYFKSNDILLPENISGFLCSIPKKNFDRSRLSAVWLLDYLQSELQPNR